MDMMELARQIVSAEEWCALQEAMGLLEAGDYAGFYGRFSGVVERVLLLDSLEEFLDFARENPLDRECVCAAFLCERGYGLSVGGYEDELNGALKAFLLGRGAAGPAVLEVIGRERIYTDCGDRDNFKASIEAVNQALAGPRIAVWEDFVYCDCEYTLLLLEPVLAERVRAGWRSESFTRYL